MTLFEWPHAMTVQAGRRLVAKAVPTVAGWRVKLYGACWLHAHARERKAVGRPDPAFDVVATKAQARTLLLRLTHIGPL